MPTYHKGKFTPKNPSKYVGDVANIVYRSSWEKKAMLYFDAHPSVLKWSSEETVVPYISPLDNRPHRYFLDFTIMIKNKLGEVKRYIVEVKPDAQTKPPVKPQRRTQRYITEVTTYAVNTAKWAAAKEWAAAKGFEFIILTEHNLGIK